MTDETNVDEINKLNEAKHRNILREKARSMSLGAREEAYQFVDEFKTFAFKGNVIDLAVGVVVGTAFNNIVTSLVKDIIQPIIGKLVGNTAFTDLYINLSNQTYASLSAADAAGAPVIRYGLFLSNIINFLVTALSLFIILKFFLRRKKEEQKEEAKQKK